MVTTLEHGVTNHSTAETSIVQSTSLEEKVEESTTSGMKDGVTQTVRAKTHTRMNVFSVVGRGALTLVPGNGVASNLSQISGGVSNVLSMKYDQKLGQDSEWNYSGNHHPYAA